MGMIEVEGAEAFADLLRSIDVLDLVEPVLKKGALNVKNQMRDDARGHKHAPTLPFKVTFDTERSARTLEASIGPVSEGAGSLALYWFGNARTRPVLPEPARYLSEEADRMGQYAIDAIARRFGG